MAVRDVPMSGTAEPEEEPSKSTTNPHGWKNQYEPPEESGTPSVKKMVKVFQDVDEVRAVRRRGQTRARPAARSRPPTPRAFQKMTTKVPRPSRAFSLTLTSPSPPSPRWTTRPSPRA